MLTCACRLKNRYRKWCADVYRYGFNGKEKDEDGEFGNLTHYDYGARIYNPSIGRWLSRDPLEIKFTSWSTYNFGLNNPIRFNDPDGKSANDIIVRVRDEQGGVYLELDYQNDGNLYTVDGKLYDGNNSVALDIQNAINTARNNDDRLDEMFGELEDSKNEHEFTNLDEKKIRPDSYNRKTGTGNNTITQFKPEVNQEHAKRTGRLIPTDSDIITHEGKHAYDKDKGELRSSKRENGEVPDSELDAINTTNINRAAEGRELRKNFGGNPIKEEKLADPNEYNPIHSKDEDKQ